MTRAKRKQEAHRQHVAETQAQALEFLRHWADLGDNRIGPIMNELAEAIADLEDSDQIARIGNRLKFMSSSVTSFASRLRA